MRWTRREYTYVFAPLNSEETAEEKQCVYCSYQKYSFRNWNDAYWQLNSQLDTEQIDNSMLIWEMKNPSFIFGLIVSALIPYVYIQFRLYFKSNIRSFSMWNPVKCKYFTDTEREGGGEQGEGERQKEKKTWRIIDNKFKAKQSQRSTKRERREAWRAREPINKHKHLLLLYSNWHISIASLEPIFMALAGPLLSGDLSHAHAYLALNIHVRRCLYG